MALRLSTRRLTAALVATETVAAIVVAWRFAALAETAGASVSAEWAWLGACWAATVAVTLIACASLSRTLHADVQALQRRVERFAAGGLELHVHAASHPELAPLAGALNRMVESLRAEIMNLRAARAEQDAILRSMEEGVIALDVEQRVLNLNRFAEELLDVDAPQSRGRLIQEISRQTGLHRFVADALREDDPAPREFTLQGDPPRTVRASARALRDAQGRPAGLLIVLTDVTQLRKLEGMRTDFAANVSHELRTPITNIVGYAETLLDEGLPDNSNTRRFVEVIASNARRLGAIVEDMLALTRLERPESRDEFQIAPARILEVLRSAVAHVAPHAERKRMRLFIQAPPDLEARINPPLIEQAVVNLVSNAIKYGRDETTVTISAQPDESGAGVVIGVRDEGPGIEQRHLSRLFERFYRVDKGRSREQGGTGLGLAIVKHIALLHGGSVTVESQRGEGTIFRILLPPPDSP